MRLLWYGKNNQCTGKLVEVQVINCCILISLKPGERLLQSLLFSQTLGKGDGWIPRLKKLPLAGAEFKQTSPCNRISTIFMYLKELIFYCHLYNLSHVICFCCSWGAISLSIDYVSLLDSWNWTCLLTSRFLCLRFNY